MVNVFIFLKLNCFALSALVLNTCKVCSRSENINDLQRQLKHMLRRNEIFPTHCSETKLCAISD